MLLDTVQDFKTGDYVVTRGAAQTLVDGRVVAGATSTFSIEASIQPVTGDALTTAPEGRRAEEMRVVFTATLLRQLDEVAATPPDVVAYGGRAWEVIKAEAWSDPEDLSVEFCRAYIAEQR